MSNGSQKGFTLLESMVAITILLTALGGPFVVTQLGLRTARQAGQELVAANLAQEGIEYVRYRRDTNAFTGGFIDGFAASPTECVADIARAQARTCVIDAISNSMYDYNDTFACSTDEDVFSCPFIKYDESSSLYGYDSGDDSIYHRAVHMQITREEGGEPKEVKVVSQVGWEDLGNQRTVTLEEYITDWR